MISTQNSLQNCKVKLKNFPKQFNYKDTNVKTLRTTLRILLARIAIQIIQFLSKKWSHQPFTGEPLASLSTYKKLAIEAYQNTYASEDVINFEAECGSAIDRQWIQTAANQLQVVIKSSNLNYAHGRIVYAALSKYLRENKMNSDKINILETGTARGFSALCMAKALQDGNKIGTIYTHDVLPHELPIYWNSMTDHTQGPITRAQLMSPWEEIIQKYIVFITGDTSITLSSLSLPRMHFAFLDGAHSYDDVIFEFSVVSNKQKPGDVIIIDDYNVLLFPGIVQAINDISDAGEYDIKILNQSGERQYAIAYKK